MTKLKEKLIDIFGKDNVSEQEIDKIVYAQDASKKSYNAQIIVWPNNKESIMKLVRYNQRVGYNLIPRGAGTGLVGGVTPTEKSIIIDFSRMNRILKIDVNKKEVLVEPGVVIDTLNKQLDQYDLFFPIKPASYKVCQVGGAIATNASGMNAIKFGKMEKWIKSVELIDGLGRLISIKDVDEVAGTEGITGFIVGAVLKLHEHIVDTSLTIKMYNDIEKLVENVKELKHHPNIHALEFFNIQAAEIVGLKPEFHLFIEYDNLDGGDINDSSEIEKLWRLRTGLGPLISGKRYIVVEDPLIPEDSLESFIRWLHKNRIPSFGHIGTGIFHPRFKKEQEKLVKEMFKKVEELKGSISGEHGIGITKKEFLTINMKKKYQNLKDKYDPENIMNRGKIL
jgi:glycolate oxidase